MKWRLDDPPNVNSTAHLVFETVNSFLQHWPNTRMRNGHNIVPGSVPPGTLLYHGTWHSGLPPGPEWTATDPEHSILFCRNTNGEDGCWHLTLITTRPLKVVYFDGSSAAKGPSGMMDTQDIIAWGKVQPDWAYEERDRIEALCEWGREYDVDGFVSEVMLCNFTSSVRVVSSLTLAKPGTSPKASRMFEAIYAGSQHNCYPGETRVQLDLSGLVSFYDTELVPSLVPARFETERWTHPRLGEVLSRPAYRSGSGIDWLALIRVVVDRYSERLEFVHYLLNSTGPDSSGSDNITDTAMKTQVQLGNMLAPYILVDVAPPSTLSKTKEAGPAYRLCATTHTGMLKGGAMTSSEKLLLNAVHDTTREICRIWKKDIDELMAWLDWNAWVKCRPACGPESVSRCLTGLRPRHPENGDPRSPSPSQPPPAEDWERPQPRCIRRVDPYTI
ncbi:hypothetical protein F5J12DRAFT_904580 [Pisolithus orientalis]|uniref:uncharacterized protein n=1 Tax=Pisolithus orientalis TaxID=936130 RepID=UPI002224DAD3|nr:uncharacterized protein F5J12DRAFT_904580 [Pisolithus orientalis]KAI6015347.1 hypothetical protein F5J12DRAFT_904580 [Pisolithus orientalis]